MWFTLHFECKYRWACEWKKAPRLILYSCMNNDMVKVYVQIHTNTYTHTRTNTICSIFYNLWILIKTLTILHLRPYLLILLFKSTTGNMRLLSYARKKSHQHFTTITRNTAETVAQHSRIENVISLEIIPLTFFSSCASINIAGIIHSVDLIHTHMILTVLVQQYIFLSSEWYYFNMQILLIYLDRCE